MLANLMHMFYVNYFEGRGEHDDSLIPAGSKIVYKANECSFSVTEADGNRYAYGVTIFGEELNVLMQPSAVLRFIFTLPVAKDADGNWVDASQDEGDLFGLKWTTVEGIQGVSHNLPVQGSQVVQVQMGESWMKVRLDAAASDAQVAQVVEFSDDLRPEMADFIESLGIPGEHLDAMLADGIPISETPMAEGVHISAPTPIVV